VKTELNVGEGVENYKSATELDQKIKTYL